MKRFNLMTVFLSVALLIIISGCGQKGPSDGTLFSEAKEFQENGKYEEAVAKYAKLVELHPKSSYAPQSQFMIGFINANELKNLEKAEVAYKTFLKLYSAKADSGMVASAQWELENLGRDINEIEDLSIITEGEGKSVEQEPQKR